MLPGKISAHSRTHARTHARTHTHTHTHAHTHTHTSDENLSKIGYLVLSVEVIFTEVPHGVAVTAK